jgi:hypothetical protein
VDDGRRLQGMDVRKLIRQEILGQKGYIVENLTCRIKLDAMENPFTLYPVTFTAEQVV